MKKFFLPVVSGILASTSLYAQYPSQPPRQSLEKQVVQVSTPLKHTLFSMKQPVRMDEPDFEFDSLNVSYMGSWGFGQSFSVSSDNSGNILFIGSGAGVIILDVTVPSAPVKLSEICPTALATGRLPRVPLLAHGTGVCTITAHRFSAATALRRSVFPAGA
jgi:hypothetical protein